jgi:isoamylase
MLQTSLGRPQPLGAVVTAGGVNFSLFSQNATKVELLLFQDSADLQPVQVIEMPRTLFYYAFKHPTR